SSEMTIQLGMEFEDPEVTLLAEQLQQMTLSQLDRTLQLEKKQEDPRIRAGLRQLKQRLE
ncbi:9028_t:CDS:2, partial [Racocetra persica]